MLRQSIECCDYYPCCQPLLYTNDGCNSTRKMNLSSKIMYVIDLDLFISHLESLKSIKNLILTHFMVGILFRIDINGNDHILKNNFLDHP